MNCFHLTWALVFLAISGSAQVTTVRVLTQHNNNSRTGANLSETILNTTNVNVNQFGKLFERPVDAEIYAQPLYVPQLTIGGKVRNVVYVATEGSTVYAFDADDSSVAYPLWKVNLGTPVSDTTVNCTTDLVPQIGITATPAIDSVTSTLYVNAKTTDSTGVHHRLHALDLLTGHEKFNGPVEVAATMPGKGTGSVNGKLTFNPRIQNNRLGVLIHNDIAYVGFGSHCDANAFHGWLFAFAVNSTTNTLEQTKVFLTTANGEDGGIWQAGQGPVQGHSNHIFLMTGNGTFDHQGGGVDVGDTVLNLSPSLVITDYFTPHNQSQLDTGDVDLGSSGLVEIAGLPGLPSGTDRILVGGGKQGILYVMKENQLGGYGTTDNIMQEWQVSAGFISGSPVYWKSHNGTWMYVWGGTDSLKQYLWSNGLFQTKPSNVGPETTPYPGGILSVSANQTQTGTGIVWATSATVNAEHMIVPGILHAYDGSNVSHELWNSYQNRSRDDFGNLAKFCAPTIANGKVYMSTLSNKLVVYGLLKP
ncbi:MAG TPA: hypothetical protein VH351_05500 [Bryobacteraceae bacterium]|nr:hypothetical protein [Bryobacteraceae bacterium]